MSAMHLAPHFLRLLLLVLVRMLVLPLLWLPRWLRGLPLQRGRPGWAAGRLMASVDGVLMARDCCVKMAGTVRTGLSACMACTGSRSA